MNRKDYFIPKMFQRLLVPSIISSVGFAFADMADALVLGNKMGETGLAAISLCLPIFMLINFFMDGLAIGGSVHYSQKLGEGKAEDAVNCFNRIWVSTLIIGILIGCTANIFAPQVLSLLGTTPDDGELYTACGQYMRIIAWGSPLLMLNVIFSNFLRNDDNADLAAAGFLIGNSVDIALNIILVLVFGMGTGGAALSTVLGSAVAICCYSRGIVFGGAKLLKVRRFKPDVSETLYCFKNGFSTSVQHLFQLVFFLAVNRILIKLGGEGGVAVFDMVYNASFFIIYIYNGVAEAAQPLVSTFAGENSEKDCVHVLKLSKNAGLLLGGTAAVLIFVFARQVAAMFGISEELVPLSVQAVRIYCTGFAFVGMNILHEKYAQSKEDAKSSFVISSMRGFAVLIPCVFVFSLLGIRLIWLMYPVTELITFALSALYRRARSKKEVRFDENRIWRMYVTAEHRDLEAMLSQSNEFCEKWNADSQQRYFVTLVIEEICMSIIRNALENVPDGKIRITLLAEENGDFVLNVLDNAVVFNPFSRGAKKADKTDEFDIDAVSMTLIKKKTKEFMYRRCQGFNSLFVRI